LATALGNGIVARRGRIASAGDVDFDLTITPANAIGSDQTARVLTLPALVGADRWRITVDGTPYTGTSLTTLATSITNGGHLAVASGSTLTIAGVGTASVEVLKATAAGTLAGSGPIGVESYTPPPAPAGQGTLTIADHDDASTVATAVFTIGSAPALARGP